MRINKFILPNEITENVKLKPINLNNKPLGPVIALIGKNGEGKSRILELIPKFFNCFDVASFFNNYLINIPQNIISKHFRQLNQSSSIYSMYLKSTTNWDKDNNWHNLNNRMSGFLRDIKLSTPAYVKTIKHSDLISIDNFLKNPNIEFEDLLKNLHLTNIINPEFKHDDIPDYSKLNEFDNLIKKNTLDYFNKLTNQIVFDEINSYFENKEKIESLNSILENNPFRLQFEKFKSFIRIFLGKEFNYIKNQGNSIGTTLYFDGIPFDIEKLSPGQRTLFAYAILFYFMDVNSNNNLNESIIIIDEPELNLHPEAQIKLIDAIRNIIKDRGQLWIATHSVHILSHLNADEIYMVKDGEIHTPQSSLPGKILNEIIEFQDHIFELGDMINSISNWAYVNFMKQCFVDPDSIKSSNPLDPQFVMFKDFISSRNIELLDFGAGQGRFASTILEESELKSKIKYSAYEIDPGKIEQLNIINGISKIYEKLDQIPDNNFDCIVLCNVLHEIDPNKWLENLLKIKSSLKDDGYLIFIEDRYLPKGEKITPYGYLILNTNCIRTLLKSKHSIEVKHTNKDYKDRLIFNVFSKNELNPTRISIINSIEKLQEETFKNIKKLREVNTENLSHGRKYANETQLYVNSTIALEALKVKK